MQQIFHADCYIALLYMILAWTSVVYHYCLRVSQHLGIDSETATASVPLFSPLNLNLTPWRECADA